MGRGRGRRDDEEPRSYRPKREEAPAGGFQSRANRAVAAATTGLKPTAKLLVTNLNAESVTNDDIQVFVELGCVVVL